MSEKILIVDDEKESCIPIRRFFERKGYPAILIDSPQGYSPNQHVRLLYGIFRI